MGAVTKGTLCRSCMSMCPIEVTIEDGVVARAQGDAAAPIYQDFCCPKGRMLPEMQNHPQRLKHSLKRQPDGSYAPISTEQALDDIATKLENIISVHGADAVAVYLGGGNLEQPAAGSTAPALLKAIGSRMMFSAVTIDGQRLPGHIFERVDFGQLPVGAVERVEIVRGPQAAAYPRRRRAGW